MDFKFFISFILTLATCAGILASDDYINPFAVFIIIPVVEFYILYRIAILFTGNKKKDIKYINDMYTKLPNKIRDAIIYLASPFTKTLKFVNYILNKVILAFFKKIVKGFVGFVKWVVESITKAIVYVMNSISKYFTDLVKFFQKLMDWIFKTSPDYVIAVITFFFNLFFFNIQETLNKYLGVAFKLFGFKFNVIKMDKAFFILK